MYRRAGMADVGEIAKIPNMDLSENEIKSYINGRLKYIYVYENENLDIIGASIFGADDIDDDEYDSEIFGLYSGDSENKDIIDTEMIFQTKKELFQKGYRSLIVWCDENNTEKRRLLKSSGGVEAKKRIVKDRVEIAYTYELFEYPDDEEEKEV